MSYTPENQLLDPGLTQIIEGIDKTNAAIDARISSDLDWLDDHLDEITALASELIELKSRLCRLRKRVR